MHMHNLTFERAIFFTEIILLLCVFVCIGWGVTVPFGRVVQTYPTSLSSSHFWHRLQGFRNSVTSTEYYFGNFMKR